MNEPRTRSLQVNVSALAIDSNHDDITQVAFNYREANVYPYLIASGLVVERYQGQLARRHFVSVAARKPNVEYLTGVGHGADDSFTGDQCNPIFTVGNYSAEEAERKIIHFLSCKTAVILGSDMVKHGCRAFFGYAEDFTVVMKNANIFFECDSKIDLAFADGMTAEEVYSEVKNLYNTRIEEYSDQYIEALLNGTELENITLLKKTFSWLTYNLRHLCSPCVDNRWGDTQATLK